MTPKERARKEHVFKNTVATEALTQYCHLLAALGISRAVPMPYELRLLVHLDRDHAKRLAQTLPFTTDELRDMVAIRGYEVQR